MKQKSEDTPTPVKQKSWLRRYAALPTLAVIALAVYLAFFSEMSVTQRLRYQQTIDSLQACIDQQLDSLHYYQDLNRRLSSDPSLTEQVVREQYNMKRDNEDVYIFK